MTLKLLFYGAECLDETNSTFRDESPLRTNVGGVLNSIVAVLCSLTNFVKVVQNLLLLLCAWTDTDVTYSEIEDPRVLAGPTHLQICKNIWSSKKVIPVGSKIIWQSLVRLVKRNAQWTHAYDLESKQQSTVWVFRHPFASKQMIAYFFWETGYVTTISATLDDKF